MRLYYSTTSPYARIARVALAEKGYRDVEQVLTDPWKDAPALLQANPTARVPTLVLDDGTAITETLLIVMWLEATRREPTLLAGDTARVLAAAGAAIGAIESMASIIITRRATTPAFDESPVGLRRRRSTVLAFERLAADPPPYRGGTPDLAVIATAVAVDYARFRFGASPWMPSLVPLDGALAAVRGRPSFADTAPKEMPAG